MPLVTELARRAGRAALEFYGGELHIGRKGAHAEPVTQADYAANELIVGTLGEAFPDDGLLSEESPDTKTRLGKRRVWIIDPLDGTSGFIKGNGDFAIQIGLAVDGAAALGVVYLPATDALYYSVVGAGAWVVRSSQTRPERLQVSAERDFAAMRLAASRSHRSPHMDQLVAAFNFSAEERRGSVGVKIGLLVERICDLYIHLSPRTKQWDTCAPEVILREAGGKLTDLFGRAIRYNTSDVQNHNGLVATNGAAHHDVIEKLRPLLTEFGRAPI